MIKSSHSSKNILGIGVDIIEIIRFREVLKKHNHRFKRRVFTPCEIEYCEKRADPAMHLAARFSAKEATAKALGSGIGKELPFQNIRITSLASRKPHLQLIGDSLTHFNHPIFDLSLSHSDSNAIAFVIAYQ